MHFLECVHLLLRNNSPSLCIQGPYLSLRAQLCVFCLLPALTTPTSAKTRQASLSLPAVPKQLRRASLSRSGRKVSHDPDSSERCELYRQPKVFPPESSRDSRGTGEVWGVVQIQTKASMPACCDHTPLWDWAGRLT